CGGTPVAAGGTLGEVLHASRLKVLIPSKSLRVQVNKGEQVWDGVITKRSLNGRFIGYTQQSNKFMLHVSKVF
ncbi:MAG: hypothetical protein EB024_06640, partial [Burkholderiaceae bacterium]|nr:hypothetical protein [Burkholderiaceae bacterium]